METKDFKRNMYKMLNAKPVKEGMRVTLRKSRSVNLYHSIFGVATESGQLLAAFRPYILGFQINDVVKKNGYAATGALLQHAVAAAKLLKLKVPPSARKIKPKNSPTFLLTEVNRLSTELLVEYFSVHTPLSTLVIPTAAKERVLGAAGNPIQTGTNEKGKPVYQTKDITKNVTQYTAKEINQEKIGTVITNLLNVLYEFVWAMYHGPVADLMEAHIMAIKGSYPPGFFDAPPKKPAPANLPGKKAPEGGKTSPKKASKKALKGVPQTTPVAKVG